MNNRVLLGSIALEPNRWTPDKIPHFDLEKLLPSIARAGFQGVEVWQFHIDALSQTELGKVAALAADNRIGFPSLALYPDLQTSTHDNEKNFSDIVQRCVALGVNRIKTFSGTESSSDLSESERDHAMDQLRLLIDVAAEDMITVSAELHQNSLTDSVEATLHTLDTIDRPLNVCYQPIDFSSTESTLSDFRRLHETIDHVHLQGRRSGNFSLLEDADIDYAEFFALAAELGYSGDYCIEFVEGCIVDQPDQLDLNKVLDTAARDRDFVFKCLSSATKTAQK
ncbi:MAG: sugar phosphate isomerase/epimerase [Rhodothermales bacterium]|nr:sugar phosphate isomerase/epimerase [Rhodothermales bacterium]